MPIGYFGDKKFIVSSEQINTISGFAFSESIDVVKQELEGKKPALYIKGVNSIEASFSIKLISPLADVDKEITWWLKTLNRTAAKTLVIGGRKIGKKMLLEKVEVSETVVLNSGKIIKAVISLSFVEYTRRQVSGAQSAIGASSASAAVQAIKSGG